MNLSVFVGTLAFAIGAMPATAAPTTFETSPGVMAEINVTSDSRPGWIPTPEQRQRALKTVEIFLDAIDGGRYDEAYGLQVEPLKHIVTTTKFKQDAENFEATAGPIKFWRVVKITWTKDPAQAPFPGVYAAVDLVGQFANVDRDCGFMVVYQPPSGGDFTVMRRENNYLDNATARKIEADKSTAEVARTWAQLSRVLSQPDFHAEREIRCDIDVERNLEIGNQH